MTRHLRRTRVAVATAVSLGLVLSGCGGAHQEDPIRDDPIRPATIGPLDPGRYAFGVQGDEAGELPFAVVDVSAGFIADGSFLLLASPEDPAVPADDLVFTAFTVWAVAGVYPDGCHDLDSPRLVPGESVEQIAGLLSHEPGMDVSAPVPATLGGHDGLYLEFTTGDLDYANCNGGSFAFFEADPGTAHVEIPGILERWWVVDLDGTPVIVGTAAGPEATSAQADAIKAIAESTEFVAR